MRLAFGIAMRVLVAALVLLVLTGLTWWASRARDPLRCPGGGDPAELTATTVIGVGHGAMGATLVLQGNRLTTERPFEGARPSRVLTSDERSRLLRGLRAPSPLSKPVRAKSVISMTVVCDGKTRVLEQEVAVGVPHATPSSLATTPSWSALWSWLSGTVAELDPRPRRLTAMAFEILRVAELEPVEVDDSAPPPIDPGAPPVPSTKRLELLGTMVASEPNHSIASIHDCVTLKTRTYAVGDLIQGAELISIERRRVILKDGARREFLDDSAFRDGQPRRPTGVAAGSIGCPSSTR